MDLMLRRRAIMTAPGWLPVKRASGSIVTINDAAAAPVKALTVNIEPVQEGEGDPSTDNPRPIRGWDGVTIKRYGADESDNLETVTVDFGDAGTIYGGTLDVTTGLLTVTRKLTKFPTSGWVRQDNYTNTINYSVVISDMLDVGANNIGDIRCNMLPVATSGNDYVHCYHRFKGIRCVVPNEFSSKSKWQDEIKSKEQAGTPYQVEYPLAAPQTYQLSPTEVRTLLGQNNIFADTGDASVTYRTPQPIDYGGSPYGR